MGKSEKNTCLISYQREKKQLNLYKTTILGTTQKWPSWTGSRLLKHLYKIFTNQIWLLLAGFQFLFSLWMFYKQ